MRPKNRSNMQTVGSIAGLNDDNANNEDANENEDDNANENDDADGNDNC